MFNVYFTAIVQPCRSVKPFVLWLCALQFVKEEETLVVRDVSDGNLNHVLRVSSSVDPSRTVIFKHAPPYIKVWSLPS